MLIIASVLERTVILIAAGLPVILAEIARLGRALVAAAVLGNRRVAGTCTVLGNEIVAALGTGAGTDIALAIILGLAHVAVHRFVLGVGSRDRVGRLVAALLGLTRTAVGAS